MSKGSISKKEKNSTPEKGIRKMRKKKKSPCLSDMFFGCRKMKNKKKRN
jgi:hypothetical protein